MQLIPENGPDGLRARIFERLSTCLESHRAEPLAVGLSGGSDSHALLRLVAEWARDNGRKVIAFTVDHRLNPASTEWTQQAGEMARAAGAQWLALEWMDAKGGTAIQERARLARHSLLAQAVREAGAGVLLLGHTRDDVAENDWMREQGTAVGRLRQWSASPVWPQGRGVTLYRPLLGEARSNLRQYLQSIGANWIDDPANADPRYMRVRARQALQGASPEHQITWHKEFKYTAGGFSDFGVLEFSREALVAAPKRILSMALVCCSGAQVPPRGNRLDNLHQVLVSGKNGVSVLSETRIQMQDDNILMCREAGEMRRSESDAFVPMPSGEEVIWDGRFRIQTEAEGWQIGPATGRLNRLEEKYRKRLSALPPAVRAGLPILYNSKAEQYVPAWVEAQVSCLVDVRFRWNLVTGADETTQECILFDLWHGETRPTALFSV